MSSDDDWETPPPGLVEAIMRRHGVTRAVAWARLGLATDASPTATTFRALAEGARFVYKSFECVKHRPTVWDGRRRVPDRDYDYDLYVEDRSARRPNARIMRPRGPRRYAWLYIHPDARVEPLDDS